MNHELSLARAIWWGEQCLGTIAPEGDIVPLLKHNMDVDYYLSRKASELIYKPPQEMLTEEILSFYYQLLNCGFVEVDSLEYSRDLRDVWFFGNVKPSWVPDDWKDELVMGVA